MATTVRCPNCDRKLKVPEESLGRRVRCPECGERVSTPAAEPESEERSEAMTTRPMRSRSRVEEPSAFDDDRPRRRRKRRKKESGVSTALLRWIAGGVSAVVAAALSYWAVTAVLRTPAPAPVPQDNWQAIEVPNRVKFLLPAPPQQQRQELAGVQAVIYMCQPDQNSVYGVVYTEGKLPPHRLQLPSDVLLDDSCNGSLANTPGAQEVSRERITLGPYPGKELVMSIPQQRGKMILRAYLAHGQLYMAMAGGAGFEPGQENVKRLFDSIQILDQGDKAPGKAGGDKKSEPPPPPSLELFSQGPRHFLADLREFKVKSGPWPFAKNGTMGRGQAAISVNGAPSPKGLGMHPPERGYAAASYLLKRQAMLFKASVALDDSAEAASDSAVFEVWGDGKRLWNSKPIQKARERQDCHVDVSNVNLMELRVQATGSHMGLHAVWIEPFVVRNPGTAGKGP